jgi:hypothetical protein
MMGDRMRVMRYRYGDRRHNRWIGLRNAYIGLGLVLAVNIGIRLI